jgi:hypothetical protein
VVSFWVMAVNTSHQPVPDGGEPDATREPAKTENLKITQDVGPSGIPLIPQRFAHYIARHLVAQK